ncbi:MAG: hypothetical protein FJ317_06420, partial [SAR202 cluster bacterium]|nr:hypothetical protein [SAR202 cluster bacterium]
MNILNQLSIRNVDSHNMIRMWLRPALLALFIACLAACGSEETPTPAATAVATNTAQVVIPSPTFDPGEVILPTVVLPTRVVQPAGTEFERELQAIDARMTAIRMLFSLRPVKKEFISRDDLAHRVVEKLEDERDEIGRKNVVYEVLGIIGPDVDLYEIYVALYQEGILGFFEADEDKLYVVQDHPTLRAQDKITYAHELVHALQQQHFDIAAEFDRRSEGNTDRHLAYAALVEGDATLAESVYMFNYISEDEQRAIQEDAGVNLQAFLSAPHLIQRTFLFPYLEGTQFVFQLFQQDSWNAVNQAFRSPPESTEQILHVEKYLAREMPLNLFVPDFAAALGSGWSEVDRDTFGEFFLRAYLEDGLSRQVSAQAATGWAGDRYSMLTGPGGNTVLAMRTAWDTNNDAVEFGQAFRDYMAAKHGGEWEGVPGKPGSAMLQTDGKVFATRQSIFEVQVVLAPDTVTLDTI